MTTLRRSPMFSFLSGWALASVLLTALLPGLVFGAPLVAITRPTQGATVSGQIWIDVAFNASNNLPVTRLEVYIDDQLAREVDLAQPLLMGRQSFNWDFSYASNSTHKIGARAIDSGNNAAIASISVQVANATGNSGTDLIPPVVRIYYPAQGAKVFSTVEVKADATDNVGVELVYFYIDGRLHKMMMNTPPYVDAWDTTREVDGRHVLEAVAVDKAENEARSAAVTVIVENQSKTTGRADAEPVLPTVPPSNGGALTLGTQVPTPAPLAPAPAPAVNGGNPSEISSTLPPARDPAPVSEPPKVITIAPFVAPPTYVPPPPTITLPQIGSQSPVAVGNDRQSGLAASILPRNDTVTPATSLTRPGVDAIRPGALSTAPGTAPKTEAPASGTGVAGVVPTPTPTATTEVAAGPVAIQTRQANSGLIAVRADSTPSLDATGPVPASSQPRLALTAPAAPALAKTSAPPGELKTTITSRMSLPGATATAEASVPVKTSRQPGLAPMPIKPAQPNVARVEPVGPTVALKPGQAESLKPAAPEKTGPAAGLARITTPKAPVTVTPTVEVVKPEKVAVGVRPPAAPLITDAALAEYRGLPVPASRMTSRLPQTGTAAVAADGRVTAPDGSVAAVPLAIKIVRDIKIVFDGEVLSLRATPETRQGISLAPLREIFEQTDGVLYWFPVEKQVRAVNKGVDVNLRIGDPKISVNGEQRSLQIAPFIKRGRTMVPLQFIADLLDVNIAVNSATGDIMISSNQQ